MDARSDMPASAVPATAGTIDVIVVDYRCPNLPACLASLAVLGAGRLGAVHVVDNAGDLDWAALDGVVAGADVVRHEFRSNDGFGRGVNRALADVETPLALILNPDARVLSVDWATIDSELESQPEVVLVGPTVTDAQGRPEVTSGRMPSLGGIVRRLRGGASPWRSDDAGSAADTVEWISGVAMVARTDDLRSIGGFDPSYFLYYEDVDLCMRLRDAGKQVALTTSMLVEHDRGGTPIPSRRRTLHQRAGLLRFLAHRHVRALRRSTPITRTDKRDG